MNSIPNQYKLPPGAWMPAQPRSKTPLRMADCLLPAGFPSPAEEYMAKRHDLNDLLITHPLATFLWPVKGDSMTGAGIFDGDIVVVNKALTPVHKDVVVAEIDGEFTIKYLYKRPDRIKLVAANPDYPDITFRDGQEMRICGVVTASIKSFRKLAD